MELARMFATLGFKVDQTGLKGFEDALRNLRGSAAKLSTNLRSVGTQLDSVKKKVTALNAALNQDIKTKKLGSNTQESYSRLAKYVERVNEANEGVTKHAPQLIKSLENIRGAVHKGANAWERYAKNINAAKEDMRTFKQSISDLRRGTGNVNVRNQYYGSGQSGASRLPAQPQPTQDPSTSMMLMGGLGNGLRGFFRSMTPATALAGGAVSAGFAFKEVVQTGREMQKMRIVLQMASKDTQELNHNLEFVKNTSNEVGVNMIEFGQAYAKMLSATKAVQTLDLSQKEKMFKDLSMYMVTIGSSADDQKGIFRALTQMFTKGKVQAEEMLQMAERGVPAAIEIRKAAVDGLKMTNEQFEKAQQKGQLDPAKLLPIMADNLARLAKESGAYEKASKSSQAAQERLMNRWREFADMLMQGGLDKGLALVFDGLAKILELLTPLIKGIGIAIKGLYDFGKAIVSFVKDNAVLVGTMTSLIATIGVFIKVGLSAKATTIAFGATVRALFPILGTLLLRILPITAALWALYEAFTALSKHNAGEVNWITILSKEFELFYSEIDLATAKVELFFAKLNAYRQKPSLLFGGAGETGKRIQQSARNMNPIVNAIIGAAEKVDKMKNGENGGKNAPPSSIPDFPVERMNMGSSVLGRLEISTTDQYGNEKRQYMDIGGLQNTSRIDLVG